MGEKEESRREGEEIEREARERERKRREGEGVKGSRSSFCEGPAVGAVEEARIMK